MTLVYVFVIIIVEYHENRGKNMRVCFIGHRVIEKSEEFIMLLKETIVEVINKGVTTFLFGSMSAFDDLSWEIVTDLKEKYPFIKRVYVRSMYPKIVDKSYEEYLLESYEETYFPLKLEKAGKYSYVERNFEMIDKSTYCIFYYNENYVPQCNRQTKRNRWAIRRNSGTKIAYQYAQKKKKKIINVYQPKRNC